MKTTIKTDSFKAEFNEYLDGYVLTFSNGKRALTQFYTETNKLHGGYGEKYLERHTEYDDDLTDEESEQVDAFVYERNHSGEV